MRPAVVTSWLGDSIGWWEGDTLVVETTHFSPSDRGRRLTDLAFLTSPQTVVVTERFTPNPTDELNYVFTVSDPKYYTQPWKGETQFQRTSDNILEYACHEGNYSMRFLLQTGRAQDAALQRLRSRDEPQECGRSRASTLISTNAPGRASSVTPTAVHAGKERARMHPCLHEGRPVLLQPDVIGRHLHDVCKAQPRSSEHGSDTLKGIPELHLWIQR